MKKISSLAVLSTSPPAQTGGKPPGLPVLRCRRRLPCRGIRYRPTGKELDTETGLYYFGARYLDPKTGRWISGDPAISEYIPSAPVNDEAKKRNQSLPGMGGVFNVVNLHVYHYAGNNPVKLVDPNGKYLFDGNNPLINFVIKNMYTRSKTFRTIMNNLAGSNSMAFQFTHTRINTDDISITNPIKATIPDGGLLTHRINQNGDIEPDGGRIEGGTELVLTLINIDINKCYDNAEGLGMGVAEYLTNIIAHEISHTEDALTKGFDGFWNTVKNESSIDDYIKKPSEIKAEQFRERILNEIYE